MGSKPNLCVKRSVNIDGDGDGDGHVDGEGTCERAFRNGKSNVTSVYDLGLAPTWRIPPWTLASSTLALVLTRESVIFLPVDKLVRPGRLVQVVLLVNRPGQPGQPGQVVSWPIYY